MYLLENCVRRKTEKLTSEATELRIRNKEKSISEAKATLGYTIRNIIINPEKKLMNIFKDVTESEKY